jgi:hypothetical protein
MMSIDVQQLGLPDEVNHKTGHFLSPSPWERGGYRIQIIPVNAGDAFRETLS